jgi:hypothetical protein
MMLSSSAIDRVLGIRPATRAGNVRAGAKAMGADVTHLSTLRIIDIVVWRSEEVRRREHVG